MDKAYADFKALYCINTYNSYFVKRAKSSLNYTIIEQNFNIDEKTGLRTDKIIELTVVKSKKKSRKTSLNRILRYRKRELSNFYSK